MICPKCGQEIKEGKICSHCNGAKKEETTNPPKQNNFKKKFFIFKVVFTATLMALMLYFAMQDGEKETQITDKIDAFTEAYGDDEYFYYIDNQEAWVLTYSKENEFVSFDNETVFDCFTEAFGDGCFAEDSVSGYGFAYDLSDGTARMYFDADFEDGHLSIINYDVEKEEFELILDNERWTPSEELLAFFESYDLSEVIEDDVKAFLLELEEHNLTVEDLLTLDYKILNSMYVDIEE
ncbi:MAG: hypothetical protein II359_04570 [Clostridia bacterium]|nr:hypothetical protein [Clostridia bacterium]